MSTKWGAVCKITALVIGILGVLASVLLGAERNGAFVFLGILSSALTAVFFGALGEIIEMLNKLGLTLTENGDVVADMKKTNQRIASDISTLRLRAQEQAENTR